jgi:hypothetical protein
MFFLVLMVQVDPAVAYAPSQGYAAYDRGTAMDVWLKAANGSDSLGVVWPGKQVSTPKFRILLIVGIIVHRRHRLSRLVSPSIQHKY